MNSLPLLAVTVVSPPPETLAQAFATFSQAADSLERCYRQLQAEVERLRRELDGSNQQLAGSRAENRQMRRHWRRVLEALPCGVMVVDAGGECRSQNPEAQRLLAEPGVTAGQVLPPPLLATFAALGDGEEREWQLESVTGSPRWLALRRAPLELAGHEAGTGGPVAVLIVRDITESRQREHEREQERRWQALAEVAVLLAHEIRNPLASLELFAGLVAESRLEPAPKEWMTHVQAGLRLLAATVNNVLHFHGGGSTERVPVRVGDLLRRVEEFLAPLARQHQVRLEHGEELNGMELAADPQRLEQVLLNLALNAFRVLPPGGELRWHGVVQAEWLELTVSDSGPGIPREHHERVFAAGFSTRPGSPGLGLAVSRRIVEEHGGTMTVIDQAGAGATFLLRLPRGKKVAAFLPDERKP
jgi:two-component system sensor histidine kinase FlrB